MESKNYSVLIVDLNNFARYPSIAIGYLAAVLRSNTITVNVMSPFAFGYSGVSRESAVKVWSLWGQRLRYLSAISGLKIIIWLRNILLKLTKPDLQKYEKKFLTNFEQELEEKNIDIVLVSTYLMYKNLCEKICQLCAEKKIPVIIGGPYFAQEDVANEWSKITGLTSLFSGEPEYFLTQLVKLTSDNTDASFIPGLITSDGGNYKAAKPIKKLDEIPYPDYSGFAWEKYYNTVIPIITGRGCGWGRCQFCSDITSSSGRRYRSRSADNVLNELSYQSQKHDASSFVFTDLKLNSNINVWNSLIDNIQERVPGAKWICSVHIGKDEDSSHLSKENLRAAARAGLTRVTTGLESGSQRVLDMMYKGVMIEDVSNFLKNASDAGISVRTTMIMGYPGELAEDVKQSAIFLENHSLYIDRVMLNRFQLIAGTPLHRRIQKNTFSVEGFQVVGFNHNDALLNHKYRPAQKWNHLKQVNRLLKAAHNINRKPLNEEAKVFEGIM